MQAEQAGGGPTLGASASALGTEPLTGTTGAPPLAANPLDIQEVPPQPRPHGPGDDSAEPICGSHDLRGCRDLSGLSEVPDSQPGSACLSGQRVLAPTSTPAADQAIPAAGDANTNAGIAAQADHNDAGIAAQADRPPGPLACANEGGEERLASSRSPDKDAGPPASQTVILQQPQAQPTSTPTRPEAEPRTLASARQGPSLSASGMICLSAHYHATTLRS